MSAKFVWLESLKGPQPQVWHQGIYTRDMLAVKPLQEHAITGDEAAMPLKDLVARYPYVAPVVPATIKESAQ